MFDVQRSVTQAHADQRGRAVEDAILQTQQYYSCSRGMALRFIDLQVAAYERELAARAASGDAGAVVTDADGVARPYQTALRRRSSEGR